MEASFNDTTVFHVILVKTSRAISACRSSHRSDVFSPIPTVLTESSRLSSESSTTHCVGPEDRASGGQYLPSSIMCVTWHRGDARWWFYHSEHQLGYLSCATCGGVMPRSCALCGTTRNVHGADRCVMANTLKQLWAGYGWQLWLEIIRSEGENETIRLSFFWWFWY